MPRHPDITGYTRFLAGAELNHAQDILADLMGTVVTSLRPTLRLAKLEGDAVFVYAITDAIDGPGLQDTIERSYFAFRRRLPAGRRGIGTVNHCMHGRDTIIEEVLDWEPNDHVTYRSLLPIPDAPKLLNTFLLTHLDDGRTHLEFRLARPRAKKDQAAAERILSTLDTTIEADIAALGTLAGAAAKAPAPTELAAEPDLPVSLGRMIMEPLTAG